MKIKSLFAKPAFNVTLRTLLAAVGGYSASAGLSLLLTSMMALEGRESIVFIRLVFLTVYTLLIIWVFSVNSERKIFTQMVLLNALLWLGVALGIGE